MCAPDSLFRARESTSTKTRRVGRRYLLLGVGFTLGMASGCGGGGDSAPPAAGDETAFLAAGRRLCRNRPQRR